MSANTIWWLAPIVILVAWFLLFYAMSRHEHKIESEFRNDINCPSHTTHNDGHYEDSPGGMHLRPWPTWYLGD